MTDEAANSGDPQTLQEWCDYVERHLDGIYVREKINGRWRSIALCDGSARSAVLHILRWLREGMVPVALIADAAASGAQEAGT